MLSLSFSAYSQHTRGRGQEAVGSLTSLFLLLSLSLSLSLFLYLCLSLSVCLSVSTIPSSPSLSYLSKWTQAQGAAFPASDCKASSQGSPFHRPSPPPSLSPASPLLGSDSTWAASSPTVFHWNPHKPCPPAGGIDVTRSCTGQGVRAPPSWVHGNHSDLCDLMHHQDKSDAPYSAVRKTR
jgi:hypothetical protein